MAGDDRELGPAAEAVAATGAVIAAILGILFSIATTVGGIWLLPKLFGVL
jgi:hypothetical protein